MNVPLSDWIGAAELAVKEVATAALSCAQVERATVDGHPSPSLFGAYVPLVAAGCMVQIGVVAEWQACQALARALFGMEADQELDGDSDVSDALGEIANMVAGLVKMRMNERTPGLNSGLPLCVAGHVEPGAGVEQASVALLFDDVRASVRVLLSPTVEPVSARTRAQTRSAAKEC